MERVGPWIRNLAKDRYVVLTLVMTMLIIFFTAINPRMLRLSNLMNVAQQTSVLALLAIGMTFVILTGGVDLSVGSNIAFSGAAAVIIANATGNPTLGFPVAIVVGMAIGSLNGFMVGALRISCFIATLATMTLARGLALTMTEAESVAVQDRALKWLGQAQWGYLPVSLLLVIVCYLVFSHVLQRTPWGKYTLAVGGNERAARSMGIRTSLVTAAAYLLNGGLVGIGSVVTIGRLSSAQPWAGLGLEFEVITAVVLGGTSLKGGEGGLPGTILGVMIVGIINNGLGLMNISPFFQYIAKGSILLIAVFADQVGQRYAKRTYKSEDPAGERNLRSIEPSDSSREREQRSLTMIGVCKAFPGVRALKDVDLTVHSGEVHALVGENGAGKSTLMKILAGVHKPDAGVLSINGEELRIASPHDSQAYGVAVIHQEFSLSPALTVTQNIFLGKELRRSVGLLLDRPKMRDRAAAVITRLGVDIDVRRRVRELTVGRQQMVEIAKTLVQDAWLIVMDEPTSALSEEEKRQLFRIINDLKQHGVAIVYISHRMPEIFEIADRVSVLRDGSMVHSGPIREIDEDGLVRLMVGRELGHIFHREPATIGDPILVVQNLTRKGVFEDISFEIHAGEVVGLSGLMGAGRTEIARCVFGLDRYDEGDITVDGTHFHARHPRDAIRRGIAMVPEDRTREGILALMSVEENLCLPSYRWIKRFGWIDVSRRLAIVKKYVEELSIKAASYLTIVSTLSGGNQQKVSLGKWLARNPRVLILDEPTRGIDVGAKAEVHAIVERLAQAGIAILLISSELPEVLGVSDRVLVLRQGRITAEFARGTATQEAVMRKAALVSEDGVQAG